MRRFARSRFDNIRTCAARDPRQRKFSGKHFARAPDCSSQSVGQPPRLCIRGNQIDKLLPVTGVQPGMHRLIGQHFDMTRQHADINEYGTAVAVQMHAVCHELGQRSAMRRVLRETPRNNPITKPGCG